MENRNEGWIILAYFFGVCVGIFVDAYFVHRNERFNMRLAAEPEYVYTSHGNKITVIRENVTEPETLN